MGKDENVIIAAIIKIKRTTEKVLRFLNFLNNVRSKKQTGLSDKKAKNKPNNKGDSTANIVFKYFKICSGKNNSAKMTAVQII